MELTQVKQLKLNVSNINSFLKNSNKTYINLKKSNQKIISEKNKQDKLKSKEKKIEMKSAIGFGLGKIGDKVVSSADNIFDKILGFGSLMIAGILVNNLPKIIDKVKEIIDSIVDFLTPIQSGFNLIKAFFTGEIDESKFDVDKKRFDDGIESISGDGGLLDQLAEKAGPLGGLIRLLKPVINKFKTSKGQIMLYKKDGKEGFLNTETGTFTEKQFTSAERKRFEKGDIMVKPAAPTVKTSKFLDNVDGVDGSGLVVTSNMGMRGLALSPGMHMGVDIAGPVGTPLVAFTSGKLVDKGYDGGYGNYVVWTDDKGIEHFYGHLKEPSTVEIGSPLSKGQVIGLMGYSGRTVPAGPGGTHLHWETATKVGDTGRSKAAVLSRFNPLSKYGKLDPFKLNKIPETKQSSDGKGGNMAKISRLSNNNNRLASLNSSMGEDGSITYIYAVQPVIT